MNCYLKTIGLKLNMRINLVLALVLCISTTVSAQNKVSGEIVDEATGDALIGATVLVKGTTTGTITDLDGSYTIDANEDDILVISFTGYDEIEIPIGTQTSLDVRLTAGVLVDEVVVTGYGTRKKSHNTGAIAQVKGNEIAAI